MKCGGCVSTVEKILNNSEGIKNIVVPKLDENLNNNLQNLINIKEIDNIKEAVDYCLSG